MTSAWVGSLLLANEEGSQSALEKTWEFFQSGGFFMILIVLCSLVALSVIIYKAIKLRMRDILPEPLAGEVERIESHLVNGTLGQLEAQFRRSDTPLGRLCNVAFKPGAQKPAEVQEAVQSSAREEVVKMQAGMPILDVVITIAPLLGLLGTASGLVVIFGNTEELVSGANHEKIGAGIARALGTTIAGLVVAVPSVVAHSYFGRKVETMAARLEVLLGLVVSCRNRLSEGAMLEEEASSPSKHLSTMP